MDRITELEAAFYNITHTPEYKAERALCDFEECLWEIGKPNGIYKAIYWLFEWCAEVLIWWRRGDE